MLYNFGHEVVTFPSDSSGTKPTYSTVRDVGVSEDLVLVLSFGEQTCNGPASCGTPTGSVQADRRLILQYARRSVQGLGSTRWSSRVSTHTDPGVVGAIV